MNKLSKINLALETAFKSSKITIIDDSESHRGHAGFSEGGESHYQITIVWQGFESLSRIARHRAVHEALGNELLNDIHALALDLKSN
jgi:BolA protein